MDTFTFANNPAGVEMRDRTAEGMRNQGRTVREFEEKMEAGGQTITLLKLEVGPRPKEGEIAANMKRLKSVRQFIANE